MIAAAAAAAGLALAGGMFAAGWAAAPSPTPEVKTVEVPGDPVAQAFTDADAAWCREYKATSARLADAGEAAGAPRSMAAADLPATAWTPEEIAANKRLAEYLSTWNPGLADLRGSVSNPALQVLLDGSGQARTALVEKIQTGSYEPADRAAYRTLTANDNAILAICDRLPS